MIKHLRWKLTLFNTAITGAILMCLVVLGLFLSEKGMRETAFDGFSRDLNTTCTYLGDTQRLSADWLRQLESAGGSLLSIRDGERPLFSGSLVSQHQQLAEQFKAETGRGSLICRDLLSDSAPTPGTQAETRTDGYYKRRPCVELVRSAADILGDYIRQNP